MLFKLFLLLFVIRSVHVAPAKHIYQGFRPFRNQRQALGLNGFGGYGQAGQLGYQQQALGSQQDYSGLFASTGAGAYSGLAANGFGQSQGQNLLSSGLTQNLPPFDQSGGTTGFGQSQNLGFAQSGALPDTTGYGGQAPNIGFGPAAVQDQTLAQFSALGGGGAAGLNQGVDQNQGLTQSFGQNQGLDQSLGQGFNQGFDQSLSQGSDLNQGFNQGLSQNQDLNQGFNQQPLDTGANLQQFNGNGASPINGNTPVFTPANQDLGNSFGGGNEDQQQPIEIGGKQNKNQQQFSSTDLSAANNDDSDAPIVTKDFYLHSAPDEIEDEEVELRKLKLGPTRQHFNVVFIRAPTLSSKAAALKLLQAKNEEKTVIYVLSKQLDPAEIRAKLKTLPSHVSKPEVFFIKYRTPEEAQFAQKKIQEQFDSLGGTSRFSDEGLSPIASVIGTLNGDGDQQFQNGQQAQQQQQSGNDPKQFEQGQQQGAQFQNAQAPKQYPNAQQKQFTVDEDQFQQGLTPPFNSGEGIIQPRIGGGDSKPVELDGEAIGKVQNFGAAGQVDSSILNRRLKSVQPKPRH